LTSEVKALKMIAVETEVMYDGSKGKEKSKRTCTICSKEVGNKVKEF